VTRPEPYGGEADRELHSRSHRPEARRSLAAAPRRPPDQPSSVQPRRSWFGLSSEALLE